MDTFSLQKYQDIAVWYAMEFGGKIFAAIAFWVIGRMLIGFVVNLVRGALPNVLATPAVDVGILEFNLVGRVLAVRPYCHNDHYRQVYFATNRTIRDSFGEAGFAAPMPAQVVVLQGDSGAIRSS